MLMAELNRLCSHLMWMATNGMDLGSTSMMIYGFREREMVLNFYEKTTGLRMNHNYIRPGGVAADLPDGWEDDIEVICDTILARTYEYDELLTGQPIFRERTEGVGAITAERGARPVGHRADPALDRRALGPPPHDALPRLRPGGVRRHRRHLRRQLRPLLDPAERDPRVDPDHPPGRATHAAGATTGSRTAKVTPAAPGPHRRVDGGAHPPLQGVHRGLPGARGRGLHDGRVAPRRARLLPRLRRHLQALSAARPRARASSTSSRCRSSCAAGWWPTPSPSSPRSTRSWARWTGEPLHRRDAGPGPAARRPLPRAALGPHPALPPGPGAGRLAAPRGHGGDRRAGRASPRPRCGAPPPSTTCSTRAGRATYVVSVCTNIACLLDGGARAAGARRRAARRVGRRVDATTGCSLLEESECLADCDFAPCVQVNHRFVRARNARGLRPAGRRPGRRAAGRHGPAPRDARARAPQPGSRRRPRPGGRRAGRNGRGPGHRGPPRARSVDGRSPTRPASSRPASGTTTRTRSSASSPPAATTGCARRCR